MPIFIRAMTTLAKAIFSERLARLLQHIADDYQAKFGNRKDVSLSQAQVTELLYRHDVTALTENVVEYLTRKSDLWLLFDNIDKGWPSHGLTSADLSIVRALLEATRKVERLLQHRHILCKTLVFLRNDVFELLINQTPDRGKEARVALDWSDADLLRELIRRRLIFSGLPEASFDEMWRRVCVSHIDGEETSQYLIDRCLMRPRALIDILNHCRAFAVNLRHPRIEVDDIRKGLVAYSSDLVIDIGYEIRDILPEAKDVLVAFLEENQVLSATALRGLILGRGLPDENVDQIIDILLWFGVLGVKRPDGSVTYIYDVNYDMPILRGFIEKYQAAGVSFQINAAFVPGLQIRAAS
ncbi:MAG TPA: hypothetical protein VGQ65_14565 [Thermoanaerobaculia bacterium]|nr:hypothetical protein [Thermoanaerobaculia bacterium]